MKVALSSVLLLILGFCTVNMAEIQATRVFSGPSQYPPKEYKAYGIVSFRSRGSPDNVERHLMLCNAYISAIPHSSEIRNLPTTEQIVTVWPIETDDYADEINALPREEVCARAVANYGLIDSKVALNDAMQAGVNFSNNLGPFLIAWNPASTKGSSDSVILMADLSSVRTPDQAQLTFEKWVQDIEENPDLWDDGWNTTDIRLLIRDWSNKMGNDILSLVGA